MERDTNSMMYKPDDSIDLNIFYSPENKIVYYDCEGFGSIIDRVKDFIEDIKLKYLNKNILLVTHLDVCKAIYCYLQNQYSVKIIIDFKQNNCEIKKYVL